MGTHGDDRPAWDPYDPLKRDLPSDTPGSRYGTVQGLRYGRATRGMGYGPQTGSEAFGVYGRPPTPEPSRQPPESRGGGSRNVGEGVRYGSSRIVQSGSSDYAGLADSSIPAVLDPLDDMVFEQRYRTSGGPPRAARRHYPRTDPRIRDEIAERLYRSEHVDAGDVSVEVKEGVVVLEGWTTTRRMKHDIEDAAADTPGVKDVENRIKVAGSERRVASPERPVSSAGQAGRGEIPAEIEPPPGGRTRAEHQEWVLDQSIEESFPASDSPSTVRPGSLASKNQ